MHRTLKAEATQPARDTPELQQRTFDRFRRLYNDERPHEALLQQTPSSLYEPSERAMPKRLPLLEYPDGYLQRRVSNNGLIKWRRKTYFVSGTLHHQVVGLEHLSDGIFNVYFGPVYLGQLNEQRQELRLTRGKNGPHPHEREGIKVLPM
jgi:hypothetical protein